MDARSRVDTKASARPATSPAAVSAAALLTKRADVIPVIAASGLAGLALWIVGAQGAT